MKIVGKILVFLIVAAICTALAALLGIITGLMWIVIISPIAGIIGAISTFMSMKEEDQKKEALVAQKMAAGIPLTRAETNIYNKMIEKAGK